MGKIGHEDGNWARGIVLLIHGKLLPDMIIGKCILVLGKFMERTFMVFSFELT